MNLLIIIMEVEFSLCLDHVLVGVTFFSTKGTEY